MEVVGTTFGRDIDDASCDLAELSEIVVRLNFKFLDAVHDGRIIVVTQEAEVINSVEKEHIASITLTVDRRKGEGADGVPCEATSTAILANANWTDTGCESEQLREVSSVKWQIAY